MNKGYLFVLALVGACIGGFCVLPGEAHAFYTNTINYTNYAQAGVHYDFYTTSMAGVSGDNIDCRTQANPGNGYVLNDRHCLLENSVNYQNCYSDICLWKKPTTIAYDYTTTHIGSSAGEPINCTTQTTPPAGYTLQSRTCFLNSAQGCISDLCLWRKPSADPSVSIALTMSHTGSAGSPAPLVGHDCSVEAAEPVANGYALNNRNCVFSQSGVCISDICLWRAIPTQAASVTCSTNSDCGTNSYTGSPTCSGNSVYQNYRTWTCNNPGTTSSSCTPTDTNQFKNNCATNQTCSGGSCTTVNSACTANSDCGTNRYTGSPTCSGNSVYQNYRTWTCNNPGAANASCVPTDTNQFKNNCNTNQTCANGSCNTNTATLAATCTVSPTTATTNQSVVFNASATGGTGTYTYSWAGSCTGFNQDCTTSFTNPNTYTAFLNVTSGTQTVSTSCSIAVAQSCTPNASTKCVGNSVYQVDSCGHQGAFVQNCTGNQICSNGSCTATACSTNADCGTNSYTGSPTCSGNSVYQNYRTWTCNNPSTANSSCTSTVTQQFQNNCTGNQTCSGGSCTTVNTCTNHSYTQCSGNGIYWYDSCGTRQELYQACTGNQTCSGNACVNTNYNNCTYHSYTQCSGNGIYWYDSCGTRQDLYQACSGNQTCSGNSCVNTNYNNCTYHSYQRCSGNSVYWYDSCGVQQDLSQICSGNQTCSGNACVNQYQNNAAVLVNTTVRNLSTGNLNWSTSVSASPSDILQFQITIQNTGNVTINNMTVRDTLPANLYYNNNLTLDGIPNSGSITSGLYIGSVTPSQTRIITYQAQVAPSQNFSFGSTSLSDSVNVSSTDSGFYTPGLSSASVIVTRSGVLGVTTVSTALTNNFWVDSFFLPLMLALLGVWVYKSGLINNTAIATWIGSRKMKNRELSTQRELKNKIASIKERESL